MTEMNVDTARQTILALLRKHDITHAATAKQLIPLRFSQAELDALARAAVVSGEARRHEEAHDVAPDGRRWFTPTFAPITPGTPAFMRSDRRDHRKQDDSPRERYERDLRRLDQRVRL